MIRRLLLSLQIGRVFFPAMLVLSSCLQASGIKQPMKGDRYQAPGQYEQQATPMWQASLIYGNQYWSYAKMAYMQPFWQDDNTSWYVSIEHMNHLHKSNRFSFEFSPGVVHWQRYHAQNEWGAGAYVLAYRSWHRIMHTALRLASKWHHDAWSVTVNGFVPLSKTVRVHDNRLLHPVFGQGTLTSEKAVGGIDGIVERRFRFAAQRASVQLFGYHYPKRSAAAERFQLLTTGAGMRVHTPLNLFMVASRAEASLHYDQEHNWLLSLGLRLQSKNTPLHRMIEKTDVDENWDYA